MSKFNSSKFKKLRDKWYKKLKKLGFRDIENEKEELIDHQSVYDFSQRIGFKTILMESIRDYYYWASDMIISGKFKNANDRRIWVMHAMGYSSRKIAQSVPFDQSYICRRIKKIRAYLQMQQTEEAKHAA